MDNTFDNLSIIKEENNIQNNQKKHINKKEKNNNNLSKRSIQDEFDFEKSLELSNIAENDEQVKHNVNNDNSNADINISLDYSFINQNINILNIKNNLEENKKNNNIRSVKTMPIKKIKKEDLDNIPIPIFSCIYCSNEYISFNHLSNEIISNKYLLQTSYLDLKQLDYLISFQYKMEKGNIKNKNNKLLNLVINNSEYLKSFYNIDKSKQYFNLNIFKEQCKNNYLKTKLAFKQRIEDNVIRKKKDFYFKGIKGINKITKNSINNKCLFSTSNSLINNYSALNGFIINGMTIIQPLLEKNNNISNQSNSSSLYINSPSLKKNEIGLIGKGNNMHYMENIVEKIDKNNESEDKEKILDFFEENDLKRKIKKNDIEWEDNYYDVYNPVIDDNISENSFEKDEYKLIKNKKNNHKFKDIFNNINNIKNNNDNDNKKHCYINSENNINNTNNNNNNSKNLSNNKRMAILNNSKSLQSTNTSSNIILKNSVGDKENKPLSLFLNGNKIINIKNNNSTINTIKCNTNIKNKFASLSIIKNKNKIEKKLQECNRTPSFTKTRIIDLGTKSEKKLNNYGKSNIDLKNIHKKILFNYTANIKKEFLDNNITLRIKDAINNNKYNNKTLYSNINININKKKDRDKGKDNDIINKNKKSKYNLLLSKSIINNDNIYNKTLFNKTAKGFKEDKKNSFNVLFRIKNNFEYCPFKQKIENKKQSSILDKNNIINNFNIIKNKEYNYNLKSLEKDIGQKKSKIHNMGKTHKSEKKENISIPKKIITENNNLNKFKEREKAKSSIKRGNIILIDVKNNVNN